MENLNEDVAIMLAGTSELEYIRSFQSVASLEKEMQKLVNKGWEFCFDHILTPDKKAIYSDTGLFGAFVDKGKYGGKNQFVDFIEGKIPGHEKLEFGNDMHRIMNVAYGFHLGMNYLLFENRPLPEKEIKKNNLQGRLFD